MPTLPRCCIAACVAIVSSQLVHGQLPPPPEPVENPSTPEKLLLGKMLFWEEQLSSDNSVSCGTCHQPAFGGSIGVFQQLAGPDGVMSTADDIFGTPSVIPSDNQHRYMADPEVGVNRHVIPRTTPTTIGAAYFTRMFWDGRIKPKFRDPVYGNVWIAQGGGLEAQALAPVVDQDEMAKEDRSWLELTDKLGYILPMHLAEDLTPDIETALQQYPGYPSLFADAFGDPAITPQRIAYALAAYQRSLVPDQTPYDDFKRGITAALTADQQAGLQVFEGKAQCSQCHPAPLFSDDKFHNIGVRPPDEDLGLYNVSGKPSHRGKFRTPTLRNVGLRLRYLHNGQYDSLLDVVDFHARGGDFADNRDPLMMPLSLSSQEKAQLVDFLQSGLTDPRLISAQAPFDHPTPHSDWREEDSWLYGISTAGTGGITPELIALTPPAQGNPWFKLGVRNGLGGALSFMILGTDKQDPPIWTRGVPLQILLSPPPLFLAYRLSGSGPGQGHATFRGVIPKYAYFVGLPYAVQWLVVDPAAPGGFASTMGAALSVF